MCLAAGYSVEDVGGIVGVGGVGGLGLGEIVCGIVGVVVVVVVRGENVGDVEVVGEVEVEVEVDCVVVVVVWVRLRGVSLSVVSPIIYFSDIQKNMRTSMCRSRW